jgi:hypothetical protein
LLESFYKESSEDGGSWHTPSVIFKPHYGEAIAKSIKNKRVVEIGPGNGSLCSSIIGKHENIHYSLLEKSKRFHEFQKSKFQYHSSVVCLHFTNDSNLLPSKTPVTIIMCEVLDNLAHDLVRVEPDGSFSQGQIVTNDNARYNDIHGKYYFEFKPLEDPLILATLNVIREFKPFKANPLEIFLRNTLRLHNFIPEYIYPRSCFFIPTGCFKLLSQLKTLFPKADFVISDFDQLPDSIPMFKNAPVVQTVYKGETINCTTLLVQPGLCDIFFPTDFFLLSKMIEHFWPDILDFKIMKQAEYLKQSANLPKTRTRNGFNPLIDTFRNASLLLSSN